MRADERMDALIKRVASFDDQPADRLLTMLETVLTAEQWDALEATVQRREESRQGRQPRSAAEQSTMRCYGEADIGWQCPRNGTAWTPLNNVHEAWLCHEHARAARQGRLRAVNFRNRSDQEGAA